MGAGWVTINPVESEKLRTKRGFSIPSTWLRDVEGIIIETTDGVLYQDSHVIMRDGTYNSFEDEYTLPSKEWKLKHDG